MYQERVTQFWDICSINTESRVCRIKRYNKCRQSFCYSLKLAFVSFYVINIMSLYESNNSAQHYR